MCRAGERVLRGPDRHDDCCRCGPAGQQRVGIAVSVVQGVRAAGQVVRSEPGLRDHDAVLEAAYTRGDPDLQEAHHRTVVVHEDALDNRLLQAEWHRCFWRSGIFPR